MKNLVGKRFNHFSVIGKSVILNDNCEIVYGCRCDCTNHFITNWLSKSDLESGKIKSCQYCGIEKYDGINVDPVIFNAWFEMMCEYIAFDSDPSYPLANHNRLMGFVYADWLGKEDGFLNFYIWSMHNGFKKGMKLYKKDEPNGIYNPLNCYWDYSPNIPQKSISDEYYSDHV